MSWVISRSSGMLKSKAQRVTRQSLLAHDLLLICQRFQNLLERHQTRAGVCRFHAIKHVMPIERIGPKIRRVNQGLEAVGDGGALINRPKTRSLCAENGVGVINRFTRRATPLTFLIGGLRLSE